MPVPLAGAIGYVMSHVIAALIFKVITAFGIGFVVFTGVNFFFDQAFDAIEAAMSGANAEIIKVFIIFRIDDAVTVLSSAVAIRLTLKTFGVGGNIRQLRLGVPEAP